MLLFLKKSLESAAAVPGGAATGAALVKYQAAGKPEAVFHKIDFYRFGSFHKFFVCNESESIYGVDVIRVLWLIQSHREGRPPSTHFI